MQDVRADLVALGWQVAIEPMTTSEVAEGTVTGLDPTGELQPGQSVTVVYAVAPVPPPNPGGDDKGDGEGNEDEGGGNGDEGGGNGDEGGGNGNEGNQGNGNGNGGDKDKGKD